MRNTVVGIFSYFHLDDMPANRFFFVNRKIASSELNENFILQIFDSDTGFDLNHVRDFLSTVSHVLLVHHDAQQFKI